MEVTFFSPYSIFNFKSSLFFCEEAIRSIPVASFYEKNNACKLQALLS